MTEETKEIIVDSIDEALSKIDLSNIDFDKLVKETGTTIIEGPIFTEESFGGLIIDNNFFYDFYTHEEEKTSNIVIQELTLKIKSANTEIMTIKIGKYDKDESNYSEFEIKQVMCKDEYEFKLTENQDYKVDQGEFICVEILCQTDNKVLIDGLVRYRLI